MKNAAIWEADDLNELIRSQAEESVTLEFKAGQVLEDLENRQGADKRKEQISIDVSAFANRIGGVIVYGIEEDNREPHQALALSAIDPSRCSKERLEQIIASRIKPRIQGILIRPVILSTTEPSGVAYIVKIPRSHTAHQASDKRYYRRVNFGNEVMDDDEIRQVMNRQIKPAYHVRLATQRIGATFFISGAIQNTSVMIGRDVSVVLLIPQDLHPGRETAHGAEVIDELHYVRMLNGIRRSVASQLSPFESMDFTFENAVKIPDPFRRSSFRYSCGCMTSLERHTKQNFGFPS
jgi:hypothetical protein